MQETIVYQILNHYTSARDLDTGFRVLDNSANERPDWFEYWPMRKFLLNEPMDEDTFYGFVSPRFMSKTSLNSEMAGKFIADAGSAADIILLSPAIQNSAHYLNVFQHGEANHPGLLDVAAQFLARINRPTNLRSLVTDSRNEVYSNYFVAKPRFWREWLSINEALFAIAESSTDVLGAALRAPTFYRGRVNVPMKIFVVERMATWILATDKRFTACARDPFAVRSRVYKVPVAIVCDALKIAYQTDGGVGYRDAFFFVQGLRKFLNLQIRFANFLGLRAVRSHMRTFAAYWTKPGH